MSSMGLIRVSSACPVTNVGDVDFNLKNIKFCIDKAVSKNAKLVVFPELCVTSYTCADLFLQKILIDKSRGALKNICSYSMNKDILIAVGAPLEYNYSLYNCAFVIFNGSILGVVPKSYIPNYEEFYERRWFSSGRDIVDEKIDLYFQEEIPFGVNMIFSCGDFRFGFEICEDLWSVVPPSSYLCLMGANIIGNLSASNDIVSKSDYRKELVKSQSARCMCSYIYASSGVFESSTDLVFGGELLIAENGSMNSCNNRFQRKNEIITSIVDIERLNMQRLKNISFRDAANTVPWKVRNIKFEFEDTSYGKCDKIISRYPFVPSDRMQMEDRCREIFNIQISGLGKRVEHTGLEKAVIGISGGLDSTLALLVVVKTFDMLHISRKNIITVTLPGFGTTDRTYNNAVELCRNLHTDLREINIVDACLQHFKDIGHDREIHDVTYENVQARERTQILMDIANKEGGLAIGTGDLSELALGWCTYNGDHMSMYGVNCSVPKTLVRYLVGYVAQREVSDEISRILTDILETPVSPELLPKDISGKISQKTEDIIGPYELHDFFLYYFVRNNFEPDKIFFLAKEAFRECYSEDTIKKWLKVFVRRFFTQQFKRSAIPDGPKVGTVSLSPRGDWRMPSDASVELWLRDIE
ncbi:MAG: NAD(+) synthase [Clostridium sp.]|jgi:NAD+ synthase (glutamine-hydrolysing)|uniref:NAD(+) synthase n=1 Tax=Clostridium sp. TaxID=1506 RepID=UPI0025C16598|nr:NAD(+) synthase [Clostridium sp.]MCH3965939.1 NAD(+) synthase [Clostridium sp.]MCI1715972.1 NAD(+) synthase [Clostridium sp.]MCI1800356.1 NAD(+) synthase [Clostridium sp.]MCI1814149.1 NAD(+) synthase [Clostridium sp.]MCI1871048.1 NAD(+) synthase [Clostridium sp.]